MIKSGGGGNRTRVLRCTIRASPSAVRCSFLGPTGHTDKPVQAQSLFDSRRHPRPM